MAYNLLGSLKMLLYHVLKMLGCGSNLTADHVQTTLSRLLTYCVNSASYPQQDENWIVAYGLRGEGQVQLIGEVVCLHAASRV